MVKLTDKRYSNYVRLRGALRSVLAVAELNQDDLEDHTRKVLEKARAVEDDVEVYEFERRRGNMKAVG